MGARENEGNGRDVQTWGGASPVRCHHHSLSPMCPTRLEMTRKDHGDEAKATIKKKYTQNKNHNKTQESI